MLICFVMTQMFINSLPVDFVSSIRGYDETMDWDKGEGQPFTYFLYGAACSEVEINCLTGDHKVIIERRGSFVNNVSEICLYDWMLQVLHE